MNVPHRRKWQLVWAVWAAYFAVAESIALRSPDRPHGTTLSAALRSALHAGTCGHPRHRRAGQVVFAVFVCWLAPHIWAADRAPYRPYRTQCNR